MKTQPRSSTATRGDRPALHRLVMDDLRRTRRGDFARDLRDLYQFYLDDESRGALARMGRFRRAVSLLGWTLKSLMMKLSPARRLTLLVAGVFMLVGYPRFTTDTWAVGADLRPWGFLLLLVVLMLELKDKLLAKEEIDVAREVQLSLLPRHHPDVPGWSVWSYTRPANDVGGDLVDYVELDGFRHGVVLGDVAGKGLGAALLTAKLQATLRALIPEAAGLDELGGRVNTIFHRDGLENRYATLFFVVLEHNSGQLRYLNAGHNPPLLIRSAAVERLHASSYPLGMLTFAEYEEGATSLESGDVLLIYSDGLTEACNERGEEFGVRRLEELIPELRGLGPEAIGARILDAAERFTGEARPTDDLSLAVIVRR